MQKELNKDVGLIRTDIHHTCGVWWYECLKEVSNVKILFILLICTVVHLQNIQKDIFTIIFLLIFH